jgi:hypothetical protein
VQLCNPLTPRRAPCYRACFKGPDHYQASHRLVEGAVRARSHTSFSNQEQLYLQIVINSFLPTWDGADKRYAESVKIVMGIKPLLGYELVQQGEVLLLLETLKQLGAMNSKQRLAGII